MGLKAAAMPLATTFARDLTDFQRFPLLSKATLNFRIFSETFNQDSFNQVGCWMSLFVTRVHDTEPSLSVGSDVDSLRIFHQIDIIQVTDIFQPLANYM